MGIPGGLGAGGDEMFSASPGKRPWASCTVRSCGATAAAEKQRLERAMHDPKADASAAAAAARRKQQLASREDYSASGGVGDDELVDLADEGYSRMVDSQYERLERRAAMLDSNDSEEALLRLSRVQQAEELAITSAFVVAERPADMSEAASRLVGQEIAVTDELGQVGLALALDAEELAGGRQPRSFARGVFEDGPASSKILDDIGDDDSMTKAHVDDSSIPKMDVEGAESKLNMSGAFNELNLEFGGF